MPKINLIGLIFAIVNLWLLSSSVALELHSKCQLANGEEGVCTEFQDCTSAKQSIQNGRFPVLCSYEFVCCEPVTEPATEGPALDSHLSRLSSNFLVATSCHSGWATDRAAGNSDEFLYRTASTRQEGDGVDADRRINFLVKIGYRRTNGDVHYFCGGTLVTPQFVLTAAHCTSYKGQLPEVVQIGSSASIQSEDMLEKIPIAKAHIHPDYSNSVMYNDLALLELAVASSNLPACLAHHPDNDAKTDTAFALGHNLRGETELQAMDLALMSPDYCNELYMHMRKLPDGLRDSQLCLAKSNITEATACKGFIGGPLLVRRPSGEFHVIGLANYVQQCYSTIYPMIYTRISAYKDWLHSIIDL